MAKVNRWKGMLATLSVAALAVPALSAAGEPAKAEKASVKVSYEDLNIHSKAGARALYGRLKHASKEVCDVRPLKELGTLRHSVKVQACYEEALSEAVEEIDSEELQSIHAG